jgi:hypothetical protein
MTEAKGEPSGEAGRTLLASVVDGLIPPSPDGTFPGAGEVGVADYIEQRLSESPELRPLIENGLSAVERLAAGRGSEGFAGLSGPEQVEVLREVERNEPAFFGAVLLFTYVGYYTRRRVTERLGLQPHPQPDGYDLEPGDLDALLEKVRRRSDKLYRDC